MHLKQYTYYENYYDDFHVIHLIACLLKIKTYATLILTILNVLL